MNIGERMKESAEGVLAWVTNELRVYARNNDAAKFRVGGPGDHGGCLSYNKVWLDGNNQPVDEAELGLIQIKQDERTRNDPNGERAELTIHLNNGDMSVHSDQRMVPVMLIRTDGYTMLVPFNGSPEHGPDNGSSTPAPPATDSGAVPMHGNLDGAVFFGSGNRFAFARQSDHDVLYDTRGPSWKALWASDMGWLG